VDPCEIEFVKSEFVLQADLAESESVKSGLAFQKSRADQNLKFGIGVTVAVQLTTSLTKA